MCPKSQILLPLWRHNLTNCSNNIPSFLTFALHSLKTLQVWEEMPGLPKPPQECHPAFLPISICGDKDQVAHVLQDIHRWIHAAPRDPVPWLLLGLLELGSASTKPCPRRLCRVLILLKTFRRLQAQSQSCAQLEMVSLLADAECHYHLCFVVSLELDPYIVTFAAHS